MVQKYQKICMNGHQLSVTSKSASDPSEYCPECGLKVISTCQECHTPIEGWYENDGIIYVGPRKEKKPAYCINCGKPYPWTKMILESAVELVSLDEELSDEDKQLIKNAIPDLLVDTPKTNVAEAKFKKGFSNASALVKNSLYNLLVDVLSDSVKKTIFPS